MKSKGKRPSISRVRPKKGKAGKPPEPTSMDAEVPRKLKDPELYAHAKRLVTKVETLKGLENRKRNVTRELNEEIKTTREEVYLLSEQLATGVEMVKQGELFVDGETKESKVPPPAEAVKALAQVEATTSPAAQFVASLGERNGMDDRAIKRKLWEWCADKGIRGSAPREALWLGVKELVAKPVEPDASGPQATA